MQILIAIIGIGFTIILAVGATWYYLDREYEQMENTEPQHEPDNDNRYDYE